ncbi:hypothetical protein [Virgibacillus salexigens]|uniref:Uncharacterized protein n=1 Tax=Virgibacillus kapii TaxID=1638645 RepID=A0ABQ2DY93_9BACI|nr:MULTISPECIES: hypothetical protein [Virgibacillus]MYL43910.1 hypothetical protein [Virgibacillus massiliensis]GGJ77950.1 hypothetical protein GCM10007111_44300 [Virgibacillus kapii]
MGLFYNAFTGTTNLGDAAWAIANLAFRKFDIPGEVADLANSILNKMRSLWNSFGGDFSWADLGGVILDLGELIVTFIPAGRVTDVVSFLWGSSNIL